MTDSYTLYYAQQAEGLNAGSYHGATMKGDGLGSFLGGLFRRILPLFSSGAKAVGKEAMTTGISLLRDALNGRPIKESMYERVSQAGQNLSSKAAKKMEGMVGNGYKQRGLRCNAQSRSTSARGRSTNRSLKPKLQRVRKRRDIFDF